MIGKQQIGAYSAYLIESIEQPTGNKRQIWIDPAHDFAPVQMQLIMDINADNGPVLKMTDVELIQTDNVWTIKQAKFISHFPDLSEFWAAIFLRMDDVVLNAEFPENHFTLDIPPGAQIYDSILKMGYVTNDRGEIIYTNATGWLVQKNPRLFYVTIILVLSIVALIMVLLLRKRNLKCAG